MRACVCAKAYWLFSAKGGAKENKTTSRPSSGPFNDTDAARMSAHTFPTMNHSQGKSPVPCAPEWVTASIIYIAAHIHNTSLLPLTSVDRSRFLMAPPLLISWISSTMCTSPSSRTDLCRTPVSGETRRLTIVFVCLFIFVYFFYITLWYKYK